MPNWAPYLEPLSQQGLQGNFSTCQHCLRRLSGLPYKCGNDPANAPAACSFSQGMSSSQPLIQGAPPPPAPKCNTRPPCNKRRDESIRVCTSMHASTRRGPYPNSPAASAPESPSLPAANMHAGSSSLIRKPAVLAIAATTRAVSLPNSHPLTPLKNKPVQRAVAAEQAS